MAERARKRSRAKRDVRTPDTLTTPYLGPLDHNKEPIRPSTSSAAITIASSRCDVSHGNWGAVASNATTAALEPETVVSLLKDESFRPGPRPSTFGREMGTWVFKEGRDFHIRGKAAAGHHSDRWCVPIRACVACAAKLTLRVTMCRHNSGGSKAARDLPQHEPVIRRRCVTSHV
eukprot:COSAG02_NODE_95_length_37416_cov_60.512742_29_plen_175_part_00